MNINQGNDRFSFETVFYIRITVFNPYPAGNKSDYKAIATSIEPGLQSDQALYCWLAVFKFSS